MAIARTEIVDRETPKFYHCTNRGVRRAFFMWYRLAYGHNYKHRKSFLEQQMLDLCELFSINIYAYAVMTDFCILQNRHTLLPCK